MEMVSTCIESVLRDLDLLQKNLRKDCSYMLHKERSAALKILKMNLPCLRTFIWGARRWSNNVYSDLESNGVNLRSFLSTIEENLKKYEEDIHSLCLRPQSEYVLSNREIDIQSFLDRSGNKYISPWETVICGFIAKIGSFVDEIRKVYCTFLGSDSSRRYCLLRDDELVEFVDYVLQDLAGLLRPLLLEIDVLHTYLFPTSSTVYDNQMALHAQIEALQEELTFLKNLIRFAKLRGIERGLLEDLLNYLETAVLYAACFAYDCSFFKICEEVEVPELCSKIGGVLGLFKPVEPKFIQMHALASKSSALLHTTEMAKHIMGEFNDSLISRLWPLLWSTTCFVDCLKDQMLILYEGLGFLRSILRELQENVLDELNGSNIVHVISGAGIIICFLFAIKENQLTCPPLSDLLVDINKHIQHIKDQTSRSSMIRSLPSSHCFAGKKVGSSSSTPMASKGNIPKIHEVVVGFDDEAQTVIDRLTNGSKQLEIVPIVGMPGLGKTTLAKKVYDDTSIERQFHIRLWCTVSQSYNKKNLLIQLLGDGGKNNETLQTRDEDDLLDMLYKKLKGNRYLVVFDDVWDIGVWDAFKIAFQDDRNGSKVLFTSRFSNVAGEVEYHNLRLLTDEESWQLLQKKVFGEKDCPQSLLRPGMEIANFCKGLPLTVVVIAGVLATIKQDNWTWEDFAKSLTLTMVSGIDPCKKSLELSYEHLPDGPKKCLLYLAAFREGQKIGTKNLMWLWIAEGFVGKANGKNLEDIAEEYMMDLISRNLVMVSERRSIDGGVKACRIHDLLLEFYKAKAKEEEIFLQALQRYDELSTLNEPPNLTRLSICSSGEDFKKSGLFCPLVESLLFFHQTEADRFPLVDISFIFCIYKHLIVLNLEHILLMQTEFPRGIESLLDLRYLALNAFSMKFIPQSIAKLTNLETFCLGNYDGIVTLPNTIWNMKKLRHLYVRCWAVAPRLLPNDNDLENSSTLPDLDTLSILEIPLDQEGENIMRKIPNVRQLKIYLSYVEIEGGREAASGSCNMSELNSLESLNMSASIGSPAHYNIEFSFPSTLKKLSLRSLKLPWSKISLIEQLPNLEVLKLLHDSFRGERWEMIQGGFPKLRILTLSQVYLVEWTETDTDSEDYFPCLQQLNLEGNLRLEKIPSCLEGLATLEKIKVRFWGHGDDYSSSIDNYSVVRLVREIEDGQQGHGHGNLKVLIDCVSLAEGLLGVQLGMKEEDNDNKNRRL